LIIGSILLLSLDILLPHIHTTIRKKTMLAMGILVTIGIALHDLPEGLAIGLGWVKAENLGLTMALAIALHNIPEGVAVACALTAGGISKTKAVGAAFASGLPSFFGALLGLLFKYLDITYSALGFGFAAGAMLYVTVDELIPQAYKLGKGHAIAGSLILGLALGILISLI
jgi:ZIP family zinc transporter